MKMSVDTANQLNKGDSKERINFLFVRFYFRIYAWIMEHFFHYIALYSC
jgi:hypothetical protein